jgi:hypothetical protein
LAVAGALKHADLEAGAISSAVEHSLHTGGVAGSIPASPTKIYQLIQCLIGGLHWRALPKTREQTRNDASLVVCFPCDRATDFPSPTSDNEAACYC